jgi:hypothetical protein
MRNWFFGLFICAAFGFAAAPSHSTQASGPAAQAPVILTVEGQIGVGQIEFSRADLEAMGLTTIRTATPWHDGVQTFEGVPLAALMDRVAARGAKAELVALNRYRTTIPTEDFGRHQPILALKRNGNYMEVRDKGPLFVIYPYDSKPELRSEQYFARSAWQVRTIIVQ